MGNSSSLSGADAIAYPRLEAPDINPKHGFPPQETEEIERFYHILAQIFDGPQSPGQTDSENPEIEGKFIAENERLSILE